MLGTKLEGFHVTLYQAHFGYMFPSIGQEIKHKLSDILSVPLKLSGTTFNYIFLLP